MIKEIKTQKEVVERHTFCDVCGAEIQIGLACSKARCECCGKDLCENCIGHELSTDGDYRTVYCKRCWEIGEPYRAVIDELEKRIECGYDEWRNKCNASTIKHVIVASDFVRGRTFGIHGNIRKAIVVERDDDGVWWAWTTSVDDIGHDPVANIVEKCVSVGNIDYDLLEIVENNGCVPTETQ